jgi:plastocyanin
MKLARISGLATLAALVLLACGGGDGGGGNPPPPGTVQVGPGGNLTFNPASLTVKVGDTVTWTWSSGGHNVVSGAGGTPDNKFCSPSDTSCASAPLSSSGTTYTHTFTATGTYPYYCSPHFASGMTGTIIVQ